MLKMKTDVNKLSLINKERQYIIDLHRNRSLFALFSSLISLFFAIYAITAGLILYARNGARPIDLFQYFTIDANSLTAFASSLIIPYAIEGFRKKKFNCPKWALLFFYSGTVCTTIIMFFAVFIISRFDIVMAFSGYNFYLHIICPIMILTAFFLMESFYKLTIKDAVITIIPIFIYAIIYIYEVVIIGEDAGGWEDIYYFTKYVSFIISFFAMMAVSFFMALMLRFLYNKLNDFRKRKFLDNLWDGDISDVEIKIEFYGLGKFFGKKEYKSYATLPLDIIYAISEKYHIKVEELTAAFTKGLIDGINKKNNE